MNLPEITDSNVPPNYVQQAKDIQFRFFDCILAQVENPEVTPKLTPEQKETLCAKLLGMLQVEDRASFWVSLKEQIEPHIVKGKPRLRPKVLKWAGFIKVKPPSDEEGQKIGHAKNGRVIRSTRGLG